MQGSETVILEECKKLVPPLSQDAHKGSCGRSGIIGGSVEFTGAPYYAAISSLRTGADLAYVFTVPSAAPILKSYSPELMVMPFLGASNSAELISPWLKRLHTVLIGPGLGRSSEVFQSVTEVLALLQESEDNHHRPTVFDADGLYYITKNLNILETYPGPMYLTPNIVEFKNLAGAILGCTVEEPVEAVARKISAKYGKKVTLVVKGRADLICNNGEVLKCDVRSSARRCGGQGDMLSGILTTFATWESERRRLGKDPNSVFSGCSLAAYSACALTRQSNQLAFEKLKRSMLVTDMIAALPSSFDAMFG